MAELRKPAITTAGLPYDIARALEPVKQSVEMLTGARNGTSELRGLAASATLQDVIAKVNEVVARLNASGRAL